VRRLDFWVLPQQQEQQARQPLSFIALSLAHLANQSLSLSRIKNNR